MIPVRRGMWPMPRRVALVGLLLGAATLSLHCGAPERGQAMGVKVGEVTDTNAILWTRVTARAERNALGISRRGQPAKALPFYVRVNWLEGACPGALGQVRARYGERPDLADAQSTGWVGVTAATDFTHQFHLEGLRPDTTYYYATDVSAGPDLPEQTLRGQFHTAPRPRDAVDTHFAVITCQAYMNVDHPNGFVVYDSMAKLKPRFVVPTGDSVYYDSEDPRATTLEVARYHWQRMYSLPSLVAFHLRVPGYWMKDDHDTLSNDCWPTERPKRMLPMTFEDGTRLFYEQVPVGDKSYRTYRWGRGLQIWLVEGREFRSANTDPDGPNKTIWGADQKRWLMETLKASDADWRVLITPTPIVGPDRSERHDNHVDGFVHEGEEFRRWVHDNVLDNFFVVNGDRHWQYHSVDPETGIHEFCSGPTSDAHAQGSPGENPRYHRFHRLGGGFLSVGVTYSGDKSTITFRIHDVHGKMLYEYARSARRRDSWVDARVDTSARPSPPRVDGSHTRRPD